MPTSKKHDDEWFVKFLDERFKQVHERLDQMETNRERRDRDVNLMDTTNKAETHAVKDQVIRLGDRVKRLEWMVQAAVWAVVSIGGAISWAMGLWSNLMGALKA